MTLVGRVLRSTLGVLLASLLGVGIATGGLLYVNELRATDRMLLAAATAHGHRGHLELEGVIAPVRVGFVPPDTDLPPGWIRRTLRTERPGWYTTEAERILLVVAEDEHDDRGDHRLIVARTRRPTPGNTLGRFAIAFALAASAVALAAAAVQRRLLLDAVSPLLRARDDVTGVVGAGAGARVDAGGPDEVRGLLLAVNALLERRDHAFAAQSRFTAEAAHELRTPVAAMLGEIDVALRRPRSAEAYVSVLATVRGEVIRLARLVDGLLLLARVDAGQSEQGRTREHAGVLAARAARAATDAIEEAGGRIEVHTLADPELEVHEALIVAALTNLLRNAAVHAPGTEVTLSVRTEADRLLFEVSDRGPGIAPSELEVVFDRFVRGPARQTEGLGLGLPLARSIARRHGGDCTLRSDEQGTTATLSLPLNPSPFEVSDGGGGGQGLRTRCATERVAGRPPGGVCCCATRARQEPGR